MSNRTDKVREVLDLAMERPSGERGAFVAGAAAGDETLRAEVMSLLSALEGAGDSLEPPRGVGVEEEPARPLTGLSFGAYVVGERIGEGGMGVVYATRDTRLDRTVAVKALPWAVAKDPHRRARLEQEARLLASLNHPNVAAIYGVEDTALGPVMILEFVAGRTLEEELKARRFSVEECVGVGRQVARGLEAAHAAGIVHRDLKPGNIKITPDGVVKILDLGVAKGAPAARGGGRGMGSGSVVPALMTMPGIIVGTAAYMSPEQARGRPVDRRADLWAFGCVVYEMLAGRRAFDGETSSDAVAAVLSEEPDWARMPAGTPVGVRRLLTRCLQKEPEKRLRDAGDALLELEADDGPPEVARSRVGAVGWLAGAAALVGAALVGALWPREIAPVMPAAPVMFTVPTEGPLWTHTLAPCLALTQDGRTLVYAADDGSGRPELYVRRMDSFETTAMPGTKSGCAPFISPDGKWVGYLELVRDPALTVIAVRRVPLAGGPTEEVVARGMVTGASWGDDGSLVYSVMPGTLYRVVAGGEPVLLEPSVDAAKEVHHQPEVLPGSRQVLFTAWIKEGKDWKARLEAIDLSSGKRKVIAPEGSQARYASGSKELVFQKAGVVVAAPFDPAAAALTGEATRVVGLSGREPVTGSAGSYARFTVSGTGMLAYLPGSPPMEASDLAWFGVDGSVTTVMQGDIGVRSLRVSPDGGRVAFTTNPPVTDLRVLDLERKTTIRIATAAAAFSPVWTPDGARIAFEQHGVTHDGSQIAWAAADGSGLPEVLYTSPAGGICFPSAFLPDGKSLVIAVVGAEDNTDLFLLRVDGDRALTRMFGTPADRVAARFSPDATMIAYASTDLGRSEVYVHPYPALDRRLCLSTEGGERPCWSGDGRRLFFRFRDKIFVVDVSPPPAFEFGQARMLLEKLPGDRYDVSPDGTKFIMARPRGGWGPETSIHVVMGALGGGN